MDYDAAIEQVSELANEVNALEDTIESLEALVKEAFTEGHNVDYFKESKRPVLSYWLESQSHLELKRLGDDR